jgi:hypothetical protein
MGIPRFGSFLPAKEFRVVEPARIGPFRDGGFFDVDLPVEICAAYGAR